MTKVAILALGSISTDTAGRTYLSGLLGPLGDEPGLEVTVHLADPDFAVPDSCRVRRHSLPPAPDPVRKVLGEAWVARRLSREGYDVLLAPLNFLPVTWHGAAVVVEHNILSFEKRIHGQSLGLRSWYRPRALKATLERATEIVAVSSYLRGLLLEHFPALDPARVHVVPYAVSAQLARSHAPQTQPRQGLRVLVVAALWPYKRIDQAIQSFAAAAPRLPGSILEIAGPAPKRPRAELEALAARLGVGKRVRFLGNLTHEQLAERYSRADVLLQLSEIEAFGVTIMEAMALGVPIVARPIEGLVEVGGDVPVWIDPSAGPDEIGAVLERVLSDPELRARRRAAGIERAKEFDGTRVAHLIAATLQVAAARVG